MSDSMIDQLDNDAENSIAKFNQQPIDRDALIRLLDYLELESLRNRSQMKAAVANTLTLDVKQSAWSKVKHHIA